MDSLSILCHLPDCRGSQAKVQEDNTECHFKCISASEQVLSGRHMPAEVSEQLRPASLMAVMLVQLHYPSGLLAQQHMSSCICWPYSTMCRLSSATSIGAEEDEVAGAFCLLRGRPCVCPARLEAAASQDGRRGISSDEHS